MSNPLPRPVVDPPAPRPVSPAATIVPAAGCDPEPTLSAAQIRRQQIGTVVGGGLGLLGGILLLRVYGSAESKEGLTVLLVGLLGVISVTALLTGNCAGGITFLALCSAGSRVLRYFASGEKSFSLLESVLAFLVIPVFVCCGAGAGAALAVGKPGPPATSPPEPGARPEAEYFIADSDGQRGPLPISRLKGLIGSQTRVWREGMERWQRAEQVPELKACLLAQSPPPLPPGMFPPRLPPSPAKRKT